MAKDFIINALIIFSILLSIAKVLGISISWIQVFIPLFILCGWLLVVIIGVICLVLKLLNKYDAEEIDNLVYELKELLEDLK